MRKKIKPKENALTPLNFCSLEANWWVFALRGFFSIIFGALALYMPVITVLAMTLFFGAYVIVDGIFYIIAGINQAPKSRPWGGLIISGIASIIAGMVILIWPQIAAIGLSVFLWTIISFWAITTGIFQIVSAARLQREIRGEWLLALSGFLSVILGACLLVLLWINPLVSIVTIGWLIGIDALAYSVVQLLLAYRLFTHGENAILTERIA